MAGSYQTAGLIKLNRGWRPSNFTVEFASKSADIYSEENKAMMRAHCQGLFRRLVLLMCLSYASIAIAQVPQSEWELLQTLRVQFAEGRFRQPEFYEEENLRALFNTPVQRHVRADSADRPDRSYWLAGFPFRPNPAKGALLTVWVGTPRPIRSYAIALIFSPDSQFQIPEVEALLRPERGETWQTRVEDGQRLFYRNDLDEILIVRERDSQRVTAVQFRSFVGFQLRFH